MAAASSEEELAYLERDGTIYLARHPGRRAHEPFSAITRLIQGVWEQEPEHARAILRRRIFSSAPPTELCFGMVRVAAKRVSRSEPGPLTSGERELSFVRRDLSQACAPLALEDTHRGVRLASDIEVMELARELARSVPREGPRYGMDRPVGAVLVSEAGEVLAHAVNRNASNRTRHAELNLIQSLYASTGAGLPASSRLYVSLKPCKMFSGAIWESAEDVSSIQVIYGAPDPGPNGRSTVLDPGSFERQRAGRDLALRQLEIQRASF
jgi:tRNA(Arg) A34 adenosine deaminase TadA